MIPISLLLLRSFCVVVAVIHLESSMSLARPPRMVSISPERHHHQASLRQAELNDIPPFNHLAHVLGCPVWMRVTDADIRLHLKYSTSFRNEFAPLLNSHSLRQHPRPLPHERHRHYHLGYLPHFHNAFLYHHYRMPLLLASGQMGLRCHQARTCRLRIPSGIIRLERLLAAIPRRTKLRVTMRTSPKIL